MLWTARISDGPAHVDLVERVRVKHGPAGVGQGQGAQVILGAIGTRGSALENLVEAHKGRGVREGVGAG